MNAKLTLRLDEDLIAHAKSYARNAGKSLSQIVADYFAHLAEGSPSNKAQLTPTVEALRGSLRAEAGSPMPDEADYHRYLEEKYR